MFRLGSSSSSSSSSSTIFFVFCKDECKHQLFITMQEGLPLGGRGGDLKKRRDMEEVLYTKTVVIITN